MKYCYSTQALSKTRFHSWPEFSTLAAGLHQFKHIRLYFRFVSHTIIIILFTSIRWNWGLAVCRLLGQAQHLLLPLFKLLLPGLNAVHPGLRWSHLTDMIQIWFGITWMKSEILLLGFQTLELHFVRWWCFLSHSDKLFLPSFPTFLITYDHKYQMAKAGP